MSNTILVVDVSHIFFPIYEMAAKDGEEKYAPVRAVDAVDALVSEVADKCGGILSPVLIAIDSPPYKRAEQHPEYKANRAAKRPGYEESLKAFLGKLSSYKLVEAHGHEADDVCATVSKHCFNHGINLVIATRDKDLFQLVDDRSGVRVFSTKSRLFFDEATVLKATGVTPERTREYLALAGDSADGIRGVEGIGPVKAKELLAKYDLRDIPSQREDELASIVGPKGAATLKSAEGIAAISASYSLVGLNHELDLGLEGIAFTEFQVPCQEVAIERHSAPLEVRPAAVAVRHSSAVMTHQPVKFQGMMNLDTLQVLGVMAKRFWDSGLYSRFKNEDGVFSVMATGVEMGIQPVSSLGLFHIIEGKVSPSAHVLIALAKAHKDCSFLECTSESDSAVTYSVRKHNGFEASFTYTVSDAKRDQMKWANGGKNFRAMMRKTAGAQAARLWFPEALHGLYAAEELGESLEDSE